MQQLFNLSRVKNNSCPNHPWFPLLKNINADSLFLLLKICFHFWPERHWPEKYWPEIQAWTSDAWSDGGWVHFRPLAWTSKFQRPERHCPERHGFLPRQSQSFIFERVWVCEIAKKIVYHILKHEIDLSVE